MVGYSCNTDENNRFSAPVPWIGIYIAGASLICLGAIGADTLDGLRHRRFWFPCRFFPINSTTLTLLSVATKLPLDFSSPMPAVQDQLTKLTGTVFVCIFMSFSMPSFGLMQDAEILSNLVALFIFVLTIVGNICTQLVTGVIYTFMAEHIVVLLCMVLLFGLTCCSALVVDTTNGILNDQYDCKAPTRLERAQMEFIKEDLGKVWLMAQTSSPQYVMARSAMSSAAGALTCVSVLLLLQAEIRSFFTHFCEGRSDYQWANWPVVVSQTAMVLVGSIAPALRWINATGYRKSDGFGNCREEFGVEKFWVQRLEEWKDDPLPEYCCFSNRSVTKGLYLFRNATLDVCISFQKTALRVRVHFPDSIV